MTTPTQPTPAQIAAEQFRADLRADLAEIMDELHSQRDELVNVREDLEAIRAGLQQASQPAPAATRSFSEMMIESIIMTNDDNGKPAYKAKGTPFSKFGVRVWDEILLALDIDPANLKPGTNQIKAIRARVQMKVNESGQPAPEKVTGKV